MHCILRLLVALNTINKPQDLNKDHCKYNTNDSDSRNQVWIHGFKVQSKYRMTNKLVPKWLFALSGRGLLYSASPLFFIILPHIYSLFKHSSLCYTPLELRCFSWPWQKRNCIKSTHEGLSNKIFHYFIISLENQY